MTDDSAVVQEKSGKGVADLEVEQMSSTTPIDEDEKDQQDENRS